LANEKNFVPANWTHTRSSCQVTTINKTYGYLKYVFHAKMHLSASVVHHLTIVHVIICNLIFDKWKKTLSIQISPPVSVQLNLHTLDR